MKERITQKNNRSKFSPYEKSMKGKNMMMNHNLWMKNNLKRKNKKEKTMMMINTTTKAK